jgi:hypothetical protein
MSTGLSRSAREQVPPCLAHVALNSPFAHMDPQFLQLTLNAFGSPKSVFHGHLLDQIDRYLALQGILDDEVGLVTSHIDHPSHNQRL